MGDEVRATGGVIEVHVRQLEQLFDSMDPSPFHEKDLDRNAEEYIVSSARELHGGQLGALVVYLDEKPVELEDTERVVRDAVRVHFARCALLSRRALRQLLRRGWISLAIGLLVLSAGLIGGSLLARRIEEAALATLVRESLLIGGWVAMWRPMEIFLYDWWALRDERRVYDRLSQIEVRIVCRGA